MLAIRHLFIVFPPQNPHHRPSSIVGGLALSARSHPFRFFARVVLALALVTALVGALQADWDFSQISRMAEAVHGPLGAGKGRIDAWQRLLAEQKQVPEARKLEVVNLFFNHEVVYREDIDVWHVDDYWATPIELLWKGAGDCEDYAIGKYFSLRHLGVDRDKLRITYVKALRQNRAHMVLTYYATPTSMPLVLDSLEDAIEPADHREDLVPVYSFNGEGLYLPGAGGNKKVGDSKRLSRWQDVIKKMQAEGFPVDPDN